MASFSYRGLQQDGTPVDGMVDAPDRTAARALLQSQGVRVLRLTGLEPETSSRPVPTRPSKRPIRGSSFCYRCLDPQGTPRRGTLMALNEDKAREALLGRGLRILELRPPSEALKDVPRLPPPEPLPVPGTAPSRARAATLPAPVKPARLQDCRLSTRALSLFTLQLEVMLNAGISYARALNALAGSDEVGVAEVADGLRRRVLEGSPLSRAMASMPGAFGPTYVRIVQIGEKSGTIHQVLGQLAESLSVQEDRKGRILSSLTYPALLMVSSACILAVLLYWMLPGYLVLFRDTGADLPFITAVLLRVTSSPLVLGLLLLAIVSLAGLLLAGRLSPATREWRDRLRYSAPGLGRLLRVHLLARVCRDLALMMGAGVSVLDALDLAAKPTTGDPEMDRSLHLARERLKEGTTIAEALGAGDSFPGFVVQAVAAGEQVAKVPELLGRWAEMLDEQVDHGVERFLALLEPAILLVMGFVVGFVVLAAFLPIFQILQTL